MATRAQHSDRHDQQMDPDTTSVDEERRRDRPLALLEDLKEVMSLPEPTTPVSAQKK